VNSRSRSLYCTGRLSSLTFVHPTQPVEIFGNFLRHLVLVPWPSVEIHWKILRRSSQGIKSLRQRFFKCKRDSQI